MKSISELLHKRILVAQKGNGYNTQQTVVEIKILEISPSENWVKIQNMDGQKYWKHSSDILPMEILSNLEKAPK